ncbi:alanine racemase [Sulfuriferula plumbiphila]|uniref:Alanine racemase n=1 Tax=Sulfuriferula plumbiphila TaxID=171865 RepID=A0A512L7D7_9PROT|nr:alanine racemase [Sulfuriferula plumbiphila]BBP05358.1 alanine racemase [Sulfuriferula plumbiphila]GEP30395.1 alanine racemase [Sulfuriferula plumbiphila]
MSRPLIARIHPAALQNNLAVARRHARGARIMAVVKANGYGHGLRRVAQALWNADGFAVLSLEEAVSLRDLGWDKPILLLEGMFDVTELAECMAQRVTLVVHHAEQIAMLERARPASPLPVFLKLNSGMNRLGFRPRDFHAALARITASPNVGEVTLMSHFATADEAAGVSGQLEIIQAVFANLHHPVSLANSAALLRYRTTRRDWVRPGIMLYGASPFVEEDAHALDLQPAMTLSSRIIAVQTLAPGEAVGYGAGFIADRPVRVGVVACGYADGYPRHAGTGTPVLVNGQRTHTLGRVSMDMLCADLTGIPGAGVGAPVVLWGAGLPVEEVAAAAGTISYELLCAVAQRVPMSEA